jgi:hypothetical protein
MKTMRTVIKKIDRLNDPELIRGIKLSNNEELQIVLPNRKTLLIKDGYVTLMK